MTTFLSAPRTRYLSNKENTPAHSLSPSPSPSRFELTDIDAISTSLRTSLSGVNPTTSHPSGKGKPSLGGLGIGRAPKFTYRKHSSKPYGRVSSIQRAKKAANKNGSSTTSSQLTGGVTGTRGERKPKKGPKNRPNPLKLRHSEPKAGLKRDEHTTPVLRVADRVKLDRWRKSIWRPAGPIQGQMRVPLMLPYPRFPPVPRIATGDLKSVPVQYIFDRLASLLPSISTITLAHRPYATVYHPNPTIPAHTTLALAIPEVINGTKPHWAEKAKGREPDMVLGIMKKGKEAEGGKMVVPVMSLVFATQCAYWPNLTTPPQPAQAQTQPDSSSSGIAGPSTLAPIREQDEPETDGEADTSISSSSQSSWSSEESELHSTDESLLPRPTRDENGFLQLPIVPLPLPSPETFGLVHRHLHHPERAWIPDLLSIPDKCQTRAQVVGALSELSVQDLMGKLEVLQGAWQNLHSLGVGRLGTWRQLGEAWACVVGIVAGNGILLKGVKLNEEGSADADEQMDEGKGKKKTAAEEIACEWVKSERTRIASASAAASSATNN